MGSFSYRRQAPREGNGRNRVAAPLANGGPREVRPVSMRHHNVQPVLDLGTTRYCRVRSINTTLAVPPVSYKLGHRLLDMYTRTWALMKLIGQSGSEQEKEEYYRLLGRMSKLMWKHARPVGLLLRTMRKLGLTRNPLQGATELDILELAGFFLQGRIKSSVQYGLEDPAIQSENQDLPTR